MSTPVKIIIAHLGINKKYLTDEYGFIGAYMHDYNQYKRENCIYLLYKYVAGNKDTDRILYFNKKISNYKEYYIADDCDISDKQDGKSLLKDGRYICYTIPYYGNICGSTAAGSNCVFTEAARIKAIKYWKDDETLISDCLNMDDNSRTIIKYTDAVPIFSPIERHCLKIEKDNGAK